jgi:hypothetical protein
MSRGWHGSIGQRLQNDCRTNSDRADANSDRADAGDANSDR